MGMINVLFVAALFFQSAAMGRHHAPRQHGGFSPSSAVAPVGGNVAGIPERVFSRNGASVLHGTVTRVSDGDTIWVEGTVIWANGQPSTPGAVPLKYKVRLDRIDAPESDQPFGEASKRHLKSIIAGRRVAVQYEREDKYGRLLGIVFLEGEDINLRMVKDGCAWHYRHFDDTPAYAAAEREARSAKRGLWADANAEPPHDFRRRNRH